MSLDDIPTGVPLTAREFFQALTAGATLPPSPWEDEPDLVPDTLHRLDAGLKAVVTAKQEAAARLRAGELLEQKHQLYDLDADSIPFPGAVYGSYLQLGGQS